MNKVDIDNNFYVATYEMGAQRTPVPTWASKIENPLVLKPHVHTNIEKKIVPSVPVCFQITDILTAQECEVFINTTEALGYSEDASVSLPRSVRQNENLVWVVDENTHDIIWQRIQHIFDNLGTTYDGKKAVGLNRRFRFYKYNKGDFFKPHTDGAWPGSGIVDKKLVTNLYPNRFSRMTFLLFLNDNFIGGETAFYVDKNDASKPAKRTEDVKIEEIRTPLGSALCFPHGEHPLHAMHGSREILSGVKYIIRTDVLFEL